MKKGIIITVLVIAVFWLFWWLQDEAEKIDFEFEINGVNGFTSMLSKNSKEPVTIDYTLKILNGSKIYMIIRDPYFEIYKNGVLLSKTFASDEADNKIKIKGMQVSTFKSSAELNKNFDYSVFSNEIRNTGSITVDYIFTCRVFFIIPIKVKGSYNYKL